jgi:hypothetical protein
LEAERQLSFGWKLARVPNAVGKATIICKDVVMYLAR